MSIRTTLGAAAIAAAVTGTLGTTLLLPDRESALILRFPALASHTRRAAPLVPDPLLRPKNDDEAAEARYDAALTALIEAQRRLARAEEAQKKIKAKLGLIDIEKLRNDVKVAEANAIAARPNAWRAPQIETRTIVVLFREDATPEEIAHVLTKHRLRVLSGVASISMFVVDVADGDTTESPEQETSLLWARIAELKTETHVVDDATLNVQLHGTLVPPPNNPASGRDWTDDNDPLVLSRFPQAWNFQKAIDTRNKIIDVGVLDEGFADKNADDLPMTFPGPCFVSVNTHGTQVAGVIGAAWGNGTGVDGAAPHVNLIGCSPATTAFDQFDVALNTLLNEAPKVRVINVSLGYNWNQAITDTIKGVVAVHGAAIRRTMKLHSAVVLVSSAGNECKGNGCVDPATWTSPFNWAALGPAAENPPSDNVIVVQALNVNGTARLALSNVSSMIGAIGEGLLTVIDKTHFGIMAASTSAAAPLVTATVAMMLEVNPNLTMTEIKTNLGIPNAKLDAFAAVRRSSKTPDKDLADRNGDGKVDMLDFNMFKTSFHLGPIDAKRDQCDFDGDADIDVDDLKVMIRAWTDPNIDPNTLPGKLSN